MLEFSDAAYKFFPAQPSPWVIRLTRLANRFFILKGSSHRVRDIEVSGNHEKVKNLHSSGARLLFVANHPSHSDPQLMIEIQRRLRIQSSFMAAYDVFLRSDFQAWFMQKMGSFSIDREGSDRNAMAAAISVLKHGEHALTIFPEGNVYLMNDRVTPFLDGTSFIAVKAQQALKEEGEVWIVPISFKFSQVDDIGEKVWDRLKTLARDCGYCGLLDPSDPEWTVVNVGAHLLTGFFREKTEIKGDFNFEGISPDALKNQLHELARELVGHIEEELNLVRNDELFIVDRVRKVRSRIHQVKIDHKEVNRFGKEKINSLADRAILCFRILAYVLPYLKEEASLDRYAETVERLCEDFYSRCFPPLGPRKAMARIGTPVSIRVLLDQTEGKTRDVIPGLTQLIEKSIQAGIDELNAGNSAKGKIRV